MIKHYLKRIAADKIMIGVYIFLPLGIFLLNVLVMNENVGGTEHIVDGFDTFATMASISILVMFQLFSSSTIIDYMHLDIIGDRRWRLLAAPTSLGMYISAATVAAIIFSMISGAILLAFSTLVFNTYLFTPWVVVLTMFLLSFMAQMFGMLLFMFFKKKATTEAIIMILGFGMAIGAGHMLGPIDFGVEAVNNFLQSQTPYAIAFLAIFYSGNLVAEPGSVGDMLLVAPADGNMQQVFIYLGILAAITAVLTVIVFIVQRRRPL